MSEKQIEVWIKGRFATVVPAENENNVREDLETRYSGQYLIKPHKTPEQRKEEAAPIFKKIDLMAIKAKAEEDAKKEKELLTKNRKNKKDETIRTN